MPDPTGPQFDPQPGDTMSDTEDAMYTYTVTSVEGDGDPNHTWVHSTHPDGTSDGGWSLDLWAEDCDGRFVYARPASRGGPQTHPRPGDTMTCPDGYVYTVDRVVGDVKDLLRRLRVRAAHPAP